MSPLHILHVIGGLGLGGAERVMVDLANASVADGHRVSVCVTRSVTTMRTALDPRIQCIVLGRRTQFELRAFWRIASYVREENVDIVHAHERQGMRFLLPMAATGLLRRPIVFHDHYGTIETDSNVPLWFRISRRFVARYVGVYDRLSEWALGAGMPRARTLTIQNALDLSRIQSAPPVSLRAELGIPKDHLLGLQVSTVRRDKGIEVLLEAVAKSRNRARLHIAIAGVRSEPDYVAACEALRTRLGLERTVTFLGGRTDVPNLLHGADFGSLSSHTEAGPLVFIEYMAAGLPIIATRVGDTGRRLSAAGVPGFVSPGDVEGFAAELDRLCEASPSERADRASIGRRVLDSTCEIKAVMPRWYQVYRDVMLD